MKRLIKTMGVALASSLSLSAITVQATLEIGASVAINASADFDAPLAAQGTWVVAHSYGRCWHPERVGAEWRPYCDGQWVWTDCGWYWQSEEPWAWACYHYGTWVDDPDYGWCWVPGVEWAPAWVEWRVGGGFIGWAPCAPPGIIVSTRAFGFVELGRFHEHVRPQTLVANNVTIIEKTTVINNIRHEKRTIEGSSRNVVVNEGPGVEVIQKATGSKVSTVPIQEASRRTSAPPALRHKSQESTSQPQLPASQPKESSPINEKAKPLPAVNPEPPAKAISPPTPPAKDEPKGPVAPSERLSPRPASPRRPSRKARLPLPEQHHKRRVNPQGGTEHSPGALPSKPAEPVNGNSQQKDSGDNRDNRGKDKP